MGSLTSLNGNGQENLVPTEDIIWASVGHINQVEGQLKRISGLEEAVQALRVARAICVQQYGVRVGALTPPSEEKES